MLYFHLKLDSVYVIAESVTSQGFTLSIATLQESIPWGMGIGTTK